MNETNLLFNSIEEAKEWGLNNLRKYGSTLVKVKNHKDVLLCGTNLAYEDDVWNCAHEMIECLLSLAYKNKDDSGDIDLYIASELRDRCIELFEELTRIKIVHACEDF